MAVLVASALAANAHAQDPWRFAGADISNSRAILSPVGPQQINTTSVKNLTTKWIFKTQGPVASTPTVDRAGLYVTDQLGNVYCIDPETGAEIWSHPISYYTGNPNYAGISTRVSPAIGGMGEIVLGDTKSAYVFAVNRTTGALIWKTLIDTNAAAFTRGSAVIFEGIVFIGVSSSQEGDATKSASYVPDFIGSVVALDEATGQMLWKFYNAPPGYTGTPPGYTGAAVWNSQPVVFPEANALIFATGNNYSVPASVAACVLKSGTTQQAQETQGVSCLHPYDLVDAIVSVDLATGRLNWSRRLQGPDTFTGACDAGLSSCPKPLGPDFDFSSAPNLVAIPDFVGVTDDRGGKSNSFLLGAGQKSGMYWGINPYNGGLFWGTFVGNSEIKWGTAINASTNAQALVAIDNSEKTTNLLVGINGNKLYWDAGSWGGIDLRTGKLTWQVPAFGQDLDNPASGSFAPGAISFTNNVGFAASSSGYMTAFDSTSGQVLWWFNTGGPIQSAPAIFNDTVYWGAGYEVPVSNLLYAFSIASAAVTSAASH